MCPTTCEVSLLLLEQHFFWLLSDFGFAVLRAENGNMDSCSLLLQGGTCRLFIGVDKGRIGLTQIAVVPASKRDTWNVHDLQWYALLDIISYLQGRFLDLQESLQQVADAQGRTLKEDFADLSMKCRPLWSDVMMIFREDRFAAEKADIDAAIQGARAKLRKHH